MQGMTRNNRVTMVTVGNMRYAISWTSGICTMTILTKSGNPMSRRTNRSFIGRNAPQQLPTWIKP